MAAETPTEHFSPLRQLAIRAGVVPTEPAGIGILRICALGGNAHIDLAKATANTSFHCKQIKAKENPPNMTFAEFAYKLGKLDKMLADTTTSATALPLANQLAEELCIVLDDTRRTLDNHFNQIQQTQPQEELDKLLTAYPQAPCYLPYDAHVILDSLEGEQLPQELIIKYSG